MYYTTHREEILKSRHDRYVLNKEKEQKSNHEYREYLKAEVLGHYSGGTPKCVKCGIVDIRVLSIDHIDGGGFKHRNDPSMRGYAFYRWLKKKGYPEGYQTMCMNCQWIKRIENKEYGEIGKRTKYTT